jgi:chromosome partitioning protein
MVISVMNNKGGTGKTTNCLSIAGGLAGAGYKVLVVDLDSQSYASFGLGVPYGDLSPSLAEALFGESSLESLVRKTGTENLELVTASIELADSDIVLADLPDRENRLDLLPRPVRDSYDFIILDCPPSVSLLCINAIQASDYYLVPFVPEYLCLEGLITFFDTMERVRKGFDTHAELLGILITMRSPRRMKLRDSEGVNQARITKLVREQYGRKVFTAAITRDPALALAPSFGKTIFELRPRGRAAREYRHLIAEIIERCN